MAVSDAYDALVTNRPYRPRRSPEEAIRGLLEGAGSQWDALLVKAFVDQVLPSGPPGSPGVGSMPTSSRSTSKMGPR